MYLIASCAGTGQRRFGHVCTYYVALLQHVHVVPRMATIAQGLLQLLRENLINRYTPETCTMKVVNDGMGGGTESRFTYNKLMTAHLSICCHIHLYHCRPSFCSLSLISANRSSELLSPCSISSLSRSASKDPPLSSLIALL